MLSRGDKQAVTLPSASCINPAHLYPMNSSPVLMLRNCATDCWKAAIVPCQAGWPRSPQRLAAHLDLKGPSAYMPLTPCNRRAEERSWLVDGVARPPHGARTLPETLAVGRTVCHKAWQQKRRRSQKVLGAQMGAKHSCCCS